jgi:hypothetical protein
MRGGGQKVGFRFCVVVAICAISAGMAAQQAGPQGQPPAPDAQLERIKAEVRTFEIVLFRSIETAGQNLAAWAQTKVPNVVLSPSADPVVNGFPAPSSDLFFMVRIPELSGLTVFNTGQRFFQSPSVVVQPDATGSAARPVSTGTQTGDPKADGRVTSTTNVVPDDPMKGGTAGPPNPNTMYSDFVRLSLMDAMLDSSGVLTVKDGQWLTVVAIPIDVLVTNPYYRNTSRKLILSIKGEDLAALRAGKITRDEAKLKMVEMRF